MRTAIALMFPLLLAGCDEAIENFADWLSGKERVSVVISEGEIVLNNDSKSFRLPPEAKIVGERAALCVSLRGDLPLQAQELMDREYERLLRGASLAATIRTADGKTVVLDSMGQSWSLRGVIFPRDELSSCLTVNCKKEGLEPGTVIEHAEIASSSPVTVHGIYWESTNAWDFAE